MTCALRSLSGWMWRSTWGWAFAVMACTSSARAQDLFDASDNTDVAPSPRASVADLSAADTVVLTGDELVRRGFRSLGDVLAFELGVLRGRTGRGVGYAALGVPAGLVLVVDGIPRVVDGERGVLDVDEMIPLHDIERVEIVRGPVTALVGAGALSGAVRVFLKKPGVTSVAVRGGGTVLAQDRSPSPKLTGGERELVGEGTVREGDIGLRAFARVRGGAPMLWRLDGVPTRFERIGTATLPVAARTDTVSPGDDEAVVARLAAQLSIVSGDISYARSKEHTPISSFSHGLTDEPEVSVREQVRARVGVDDYLGPLHVEAQLGAGRHANVLDVPLFPSAGVFEDGGALALRSTALVVGGLVRVDAPLNDSHRLLVGAVGDVTTLSQRSSSTDAVTGEPASVSTTLEDRTAGASLSGEYQGDLPFDVRATVGAALEWRASFPVVLAPRASLAWDPVDEVRLHASYAEGVRAPDRYDLFNLSAAVINGRVLSVAANTSLRPEHVRMLELGAAFQPSFSLRVGARAFGLRHEDAPTFEAARGVLRPVNLAPRLVGGAELFARISPFEERLVVDGGVLGARTVDGGDLGADALQAVAGLSAALVDTVRVGARARATHLLGDAARSPDAAILDAYASFDPLPALSITLALRNLLDANEQTVDTSGQPFAPPATYPGAGRALLVTVEGRLF